jgi:DNA-binding response OmpR family regulator
MISSQNAPNLTDSATRRRVWVLEDSQEVILTYQLLLADRYDLKIFTNLADFSAAYKSAPFPDLMLADLLLPDGCFLDILESQEWRRRPIAPLLVSSGVTDISPMRNCLAMGALDYIVKPFVHNELLVKIERALSLVVPGQGQIVHIDPLTRCVEHYGKISQPLTSREMQIMSLMQAATQEAIKRSEIITKVWGKTKVTTKCLDVHLSHLRSKMLEIGLEIRLIGNSEYQLVPRENRAS